MKVTYKSTLLLIILFCAYSIGYSQTNRITIKHIANAGLYMTDGDLNVYVDFPYKSGAFGYTEYNPAELDSIKNNSLFLFTHRHGDHFSKKLLRKRNATVYGSWKLKKNDQNGSEIISDYDNQFAVKAYKSKHRFSITHCSYLITWHGKRIFISGDAESPEIIQTIENIDWAFVPEWLLYYAKEGNVKIDAKQIGILHLYPNEKVEADYGENVYNLRDSKRVITIEY